MVSKPCDGAPLSIPIENIEGRANVYSSRRKGRIRFAGLMCLLAWIIALSHGLAYFHLSYKRLALAIALHDFPFAGKEAAGDYLRRAGREAAPSGADQVHRVDAMIGWLRSRMQLRENPINHPNAVFLIEHGGICGQFASSLVDLLRANGIEARQVMLNWDGKSTAHVIVEAKVDGNWVAFDPLAFGGGVYSGNEFVTHSSEGGRSLNALELYDHIRSLPAGNAFGSAFFAQGRAIKVEACSNCAELKVTPELTYGRDWPVIYLDDQRGKHWLYELDDSLKPRDVVMWNAAPYFTRITIWFGTSPLVFHLEWVPLSLFITGYVFFRLRGKFGRRKFLTGQVALAAALVVYTGMMISIWWHRYLL